MPLNKPPCPITITCPGSDTPISNFSSEDLDLVQFASISFPFYNPDNPFGDSSTPAPGGLFSAEGCTQVCYSATSQEAANLCAEIQAFQCDSGNRNPPPQLFYNANQTCCAQCPDGTAFCWTVPAGSFVSTSQVLADRVAQEHACQQANAHVLCLPTLPGACIEEPYSFAFTVPTRNGPLSFSISGNLPPGIGFAKTGAASAVFVGTPTQSGSFAFTLTATDQSGGIMSKVYVFNVLGISNINTLPQPTVGTAYSQQLTVVGGVAPFTFTVVGGTLPEGLTISPSGLISGTPTTQGTSTFTIQVTDSSP